LLYQGKSCDFDFGDYLQASTMPFSAEICSDAWSAYQASGSTERFVWNDWASESLNAYRTCIQNLGMPEALLESVVWL
jgi:hypothetical protein